MNALETLDNVTPKMGSKGPPPLPTVVLPAIPAPLATPAEEIFFVEGVDGHAESLPSSEPEPPPSIDLPEPIAETRGEEDELWLEEPPAPEDPARTRRRKIARIGVAWGAIVTLTLGGAAAFLNHRAHTRAAAMASASGPQVDTAHASMAASAAPATASAFIGPPAPPAGAKVAATHATASAVAAVPLETARATTHKGAAAPAGHAATAAHATKARAKHAVTASAPRAPSTRKRP